MLHVPFRDEYHDLLGVPAETPITEERVDGALLYHSALIATAQLNYTCKGTPFFAEGGTLVSLEKWYDIMKEETPNTTFIQLSISQIKSLCLRQLLHCAIEEDFSSK